MKMAGDRKPGECDHIACRRQATRRVLTEVMLRYGARGYHGCDEHAAALIADGKRKGLDWLSLDIPTHGGAA